MPLHETPSGKCFQRHDLLNFINVLYDGDLHAKRVLSLANATLGVLTSASLAIHAVGRGLAQAMGTLTKHGVKQVDRLLSNRGVHVWTFFAYWTPYIVGARTEVVVALDWTSFAPDAQDTIVLSMVTGHGRATPLLWKTVASSTLKGNQRATSTRCCADCGRCCRGGESHRGSRPGLCRLQAVLRVGDRTGLRIRDSVARRRLCDECARRTASGRRVGRVRRARTAAGGRSGDRRARMACGRRRVRPRPEDDEPWCLVASEATVPTRVLIRYYGKRWGIEAGFRDIKDMRFGMGLSSMHVSRPDRRDRLLLISALAIAVLSLLGAAGERIGYDRW